MRTPEIRIVGHDLGPAPLSVKRTNTLFTSLTDSTEKGISGVLGETSSVFSLLLRGRCPKGRLDPTQRPRSVRRVSVGLEVLPTPGRPSHRWVTTVGYLQVTVH